MAYNYSEPGVRLRRPAGREGRWNPNGLDDEIVCPYFSAVVPGGEAIQALDELRAAHSNITPIIAGTVHNAGLLLEGLAFRQSARSGGVRGFLGRVVDNLGGRQASTSDSTTIDPLTYVAAPTGDIAKTLEAARSFDIGDWLADARAKEEAVIAEYGDDDERDAGWPPRGEWPDDAVSNNGPWLIMDQPAGSYRDSHDCFFRYADWFLVRDPGRRP